MSMYSHVLNALHRSPNIRSVGKKEETDTMSFEPLPHWSHTVECYVAPRIGVYEVVDLQLLMLGLVPGLEPTMRDDFFDAGDKIWFGVLYFDESYGKETIRKEICLTDKTSPSDGFVDGSRVIEYTADMMRRTCVFLFPNIEIAMRSLWGKRLVRISKCELAKYR